MPSLTRLDPKLQPGVTGHLHLGVEQQALSRTQFGDPPEIDGVADEDVFGVTTAPPEPYAANESIDPASHRPESVGVIPAHVSTDTSDAVEQGSMRRTTFDSLLVADRKFGRVEANPNPIAGR